MLAAWRLSVTKVAVQLPGYGLDFFELFGREFALPAFVQVEAGGLVAVMLPVRWMEWLHVGLGILAVKGTDEDVGPPVAAQGVLRGLPEFQHGGIEGKREAGGEGCQCCGGIGGEILIPDHGALCFRVALVGGEDGAQVVHQPLRHTVRLHWFPAQVGGANGAQIADEEEKKGLEATVL